MHNLFLGPLLLFAVLLSELLDPHVAPKCCFSFLVGSNFHSGALQFPLNSSPWMTFEQRRAGASVSVIPSDATEVSPDRNWTKSKSGGVWSFARSSSASSNPVTPSQADPKCGSWRLFLQVLYVLQLCFPLTPNTGHPGFTCPRRSVPALLSCTLFTLFRNFK